MSAISISFDPRNEGDQIGENPTLAKRAVAGRLLNCREVFPVRQNALPVPAIYFPVIWSREFASEPWKSGLLDRLIGQMFCGFENFPCIFTVYQGNWPETGSLETAPTTILPAANGLPDRFCGESRRTGRFAASLEAVETQEQRRMPAYRQRSLFRFCCVQAVQSKMESGIGSDAERSALRGPVRWKMFHPTKRSCR